jgi:xanthine dehydrogenase YagS FAD-binding subunit
MKPFDYIAARQLEDAFAPASGNAMRIAGGTELLNWMRLGISEPGFVIDIGRLPNMNRIEVDGDQLVIGALATLNEVGESDIVRREAAGLADACLKAASAQIRNRATIGGNILQKTRCEYFRAEAPLPWPCNKREPGSGCAARQGINERHAIFGWTDACVATHPSDPAVALACLDAQVEVAGRGGRRLIPMTAFHLTQEEAAASSRDAARVETQLHEDELIIDYHIPVRPGRRSAYLKVRERESFEYALVSAAAAIELDGPIIRLARIALGSVAQKPWRLTEAERALIGQTFDRATLEAAIADALRSARPLAHNAYKITLARKAAVRALLAAGGQA